MNDVRVILLSLLSLFASLSLQAACVLDKHTPESLLVCEELAQSGDPDALWQLGLFHEMDNPGPDHKEKAFRLLERSANLGNASGQYHLGRFYDYAIAVSKNAFEAVRWYEKSAAQGHLNAFNALGKVYFEGRGVTADYTRAAHWFMQSAEKQDATGQFYVDLIRAYGTSSAKDHKSAFHYLMQASETDNVDAWYYLGMLYLTGNGTGVDLDKALHWLKKAAGQNHLKAKSEIKSIARKAAKKRSQATDAGPGMEPDRLQAMPLNVPVEATSSPAPAASGNPIKSSGSLFVSIVIALVLGGIAVFVFRQKSRWAESASDKEAELVRQAQAYVQQQRNQPVSQSDRQAPSSESTAPAGAEVSSDFYDTLLLEQARSELETNKLDPSSWQKAMNEANGNHARAELLYLKFRVKQLQT